jgi:hypothetical protein
MTNINLSIDRRNHLRPRTLLVKSHGSAINSRDSPSRGTTDIHEKLEYPDDQLIWVERRAKVVCRDLREGGKVSLDFCLGP